MDPVVQKLVTLRETVGFCLHPASWSNALYWANIKYTGQFLMFVDYFGGNDGSEVISSRSEITTDN